MNITENQLKLLINDPKYAKMLEEVMLDKECTLKIEKVKEVHKNDITPPNPDAKEKRWQTFVFDENYYNNRKKIYGGTENEVFLKLYDFYFKTETVHTLESFFPIWVDHRKKRAKSIRTVRRNINHWNKYYLNSSIIKIPLHKLDADTIELFIHAFIKPCGFTETELYNMAFIIKDCLKLAKKQKIIPYNPYIEVDLTIDSCSPAKHKEMKEGRIFFPDEKDDFFKELSLYLSLNPENTKPYAIIILFLLGLRIGEIVALEWKDIDVKHSILHLRKMETLDEEENGKLHAVIVNYMKGRKEHSLRDLGLSDYELDIFNKIRSINEQYGYKDNDYIFCDEKGRMSPRKIDDRIRCLCENCKIIPPKSAHDIRRTVATELYLNGVDLEIIRKFLGHEDILSTKDYIYDFDEKKKESNDLIKGRAGLIGLKLD